jgi:hypothetical protein
VYLLSPVFSLDKTNRRCVSNGFILRELAGEMLNALISLPAVVGEDFRSLDAAPFLLLLA